MIVFHVINKAFVAHDHEKQNAAIYNKMIDWTVIVVERLFPGIQSMKHWPVAPAVKVKVMLDTRSDCSYGQTEVCGLIIDVVYNLTPEA